MSDIHRIIAFDVETPNRYGNSICSIGITISEPGKAPVSRQYLVNPEADFEYINIRIHGIYPEDVEFSPTFPELWQVIGPVMNSGVLAAHNAAFGLRVLRGLFGRYGIEQKPLPYICSCQTSRKILKNMPNHKLDTICRGLGIPLCHHDAGSDSLACAEILRRFMASGICLEPYLRLYDFSPDGGTCKIT